MKQNNINADHFFINPFPAIFDDCLFLLTD